MQSMEEFILNTKEKVIRKIEEAKSVKEKKKIVEDNCFYYPFISPEDFEEYIEDDILSEDMDFKDELRAILKTPEQVENEANLKSIEEGKKVAERHIEYVKRIIRNYAENGKYTCIGDKKIIEYEFEIPALDFSLHLPMFGYRDVGGVKIESGIRCEIRDMVLYNSYKQTITSLANEIGATIDIICCFEENGMRTYIDIPGTNFSLNSRNYVHLEKRTNVYLTGRIEI